MSVFLLGPAAVGNPELNASDAFVAAWLPGTEGGGIADVMFRNAADRGESRFPRQAVVLLAARPAQTSMNRNDAAYQPLFPYGFGLTYANGASAQTSSAK